MEKIGLPDKYYNGIIKSTTLIDSGRKALLTQGQEVNGRKAYIKGIKTATIIFKEAQVTKDPTVIVRTERFFLRQELSLCDPADKLTIHGLNHSINLLNDAMRSLSAVENPIEYAGADKTHLTSQKNRVQSVPKDAFHKACNSHCSMLQGSIRSTGVSLDEKALFQLRAENMKVAVSLYIEKQKAALGLPANAKTKSNDREI